jgi:hypothetical protein
MAFPDMQESDLEIRVRTYLNEAVPNFFSSAEIMNWLSLAAKDIAENTTCVRRILSAQTTAATREVTFNAYKVFHVEYLPSTGRTLMLTKIDPLREGHYPADGTTPQYWYELNGSIGIEPIPDAVYNLRLYVADIPKMVVI